MIYRLLLLLCLLPISGSAYADFWKDIREASKVPMNTPSESKRIGKPIEKAIKRAGKLPLPASPLDDVEALHPVKEIDIKDPEISKAQKAYALDRFEFEGSLMEKTLYAIQWNHSMTVIIAWVVHALLLIGVIFSTLEFYKSFSYSRSEKHNHEIEISKEKLILKTSLNGILMLGVSLFFYALFIVYVYPLN